MAITFVLGRAGSGKTRRCFEAIVAELRRRPMGPPIFWLVPRQATFSTERELTCKSGLGGFCRARVLSFQELGREILDDCGGSPVPLVTPLGRQMILAHLLRQHETKLKFFQSVARQPGLAARLDATFAEFEREGRDANDLNSLHNQMAGESEGTFRKNIALLDKIHDLHLIYNSYTDFLGQERLDQHRRLLRVLSCIDQSKLFDGAIIYVDGFTEFTAYERQVLARLGKKCRLVEITLPMDPSSPLLHDPHQLPPDLSLFHSVEMTYRKLRFTFHQEQTPLDGTPVLLHENHRAAIASLRSMEPLLFDKAIVYVQNRESAGIELLEAPDRRAEVDAAARRILALVSAGYRCRDIGVLVRDLTLYHELIDTVFREHGIPYFADRRRATAHHPLPQFLRSVLMLAQQRWSHEWMMMLLKSGLAGIPFNQSDALENYVLRHRVRGEQWASEESWTFHASGLLGSEEQFVEPDLTDMESLGAPPCETVLIDRDRRALVAKLRPFFDATGNKRPLREMTTALFDIIEMFDVRRQLGDWMQQAHLAGDYEQRDEHEQVWTKLTEMLEELVDVLGDQPVTLGAFQEIVESSLDHFEFALTPPTVDQVLVGQADRTRPPSLKAVLVLGLNEGIFPKVSAEDSVLSDADRRELHSRDIHIAPSTDRRLLDENLLGYQAFTAASDLLYVSRSISEANGKPSAESLYFRKLRQMFPKARFTQLPREQFNDASLIGTPSQLVTGLMRWARAPVEAPTQATEPAPWPALYQWFAAYPTNDDRLDRIRSSAWKALSAANIATLSSAIAARLFPAPLQADVSQLETFAACPFRHFARHGLRLQPRDNDDGITAMDMGHVYHHVLERVVRFMLRRHASWASLLEAERDSVVHAATQEVGQSLRNEVLLGTARNRYLLQRIENTLVKVIANQTAIEGRGNFHPKLARVPFGQGGSLSFGTLPAYRLRTPAGQEALLRGKIDRIDVLENSSEFAVIDYKLSASRLPLDEVYHGLSLQLLTYLLVLEASGQPLLGASLSPAAAFYVRLLRSLGNVDHPSDAIGPDDPLFHLASKPRGLIDERYLRDFDRDIKGPSKVIAATIKQDGKPGSKNRSSDTASPDEFAAMLMLVRRRLGECTDGILTGRIDVSPYMIRDRTPCSRCEFRSVCRFESSSRGYRILPAMDRETVLQKAVEERPHVQ